MYRFNFMNTNDIINTEADFIYKRANQLALNLPVGDTKLQGFRITSEELSYFPISPNLLPILMHTKLFGIPLEFVNLIIALIAFAQRYPRLFWKNAHKLIELSNEDDNQHHINPSKLKNAMLLMQGEYMYLTNDNMMKQSVINLVHKNKIENGVLMPKYKMSPIVKRVLGSERPSPIPQHRPYDYSQQNLYNSQTGSQAQLNNQMRMSPAKDVHRPLITPQYTWAESGVSKQGSTVQMNDHTEHGFVNSFGTLQRTNKPNDEMCGSLRGVPTSILSGQHYGTLQNRPINPVRYSPIRHRPQPPIQQQIYDPKFQASSLYGTYGRQENMQPFNNKALNPIINKQPPQYMMNKDGTNNKILSPQTINKNGLALSYTGTLSSSNKQYETSSQFLPPSTHSAVRENSFGNYGYKKGLSTGINVPSKGNDDRFENIYGQISESSNLKKLVSVNESPRSNHSNDETVAKGMTEYATSIV
uniref:Anaphase-promoting complex subunit 1 n=1 Tax=Rhabditophanes sp. KR3021 TaxID=114890 RepID=A0AC35U8B7_9BILA